VRWAEHGKRSAAVRSRAGFASMLDLVYLDEGAYTKIWAPLVDEGGGAHLSGVRGTRLPHRGDFR